MLKSIRLIAVECGVHRTTLNKAIDRGDIPAEKHNGLYLIDDESPLFKEWLAGYRTGRPRREEQPMNNHPETIQAETPDAPRWITTEAGQRAWRENLAWRVNASGATGIGAKQYRKQLLAEAERMYNR